MGEGGSRLTVGLIFVNLFRVDVQDWFQPSAGQGEGYYFGISNFRAGIIRIC